MLLGVEFKSGLPWQKYVQIEKNKFDLSLFKLSSLHIYVLIKLNESVPNPTNSLFFLFNFLHN